MATLELQGYSYEERLGLVPSLTTVFTSSGGWVLERRALSPNTMEFRLDIQLRTIDELYAGLVATGVELTRATHAMLANLCTCRHHLGRTLEPGQVLSLRLEVSFLEDITLQSLLLAANAPC